MNTQLNKSILIIVSGMILSLSSLSRAATYGGGSGDPNDPYQIWDPNQMNTIGTNPNDWDKHFKLMTDIDMSIYTGTQYNIIGNSLGNPFNGTFDGNGHVISNLTYTTTESIPHVGLFGYTGSSSLIQNLGIENAIFSSYGYFNVGGLVGKNYGSITTCHATGRVCGSDSVGGLVGENQGMITLCYATCSISVNGIRGGGLAGRNYGSITTCHATGAVAANGAVGGLVGQNTDFGVITDCYATGTVIGEAKPWGSSEVGGLVGGNVGSITSSYATGQVSGDDAGGLVGCNGREGESSLGTITACYSTGSVNGRVNNNDIGGLVSRNYGTIASCYAFGGAAGLYRVGGLIGSNAGVVISCYSTGSAHGTYNVGGSMGMNNSSSVTACFWDIQTSGTTNGVGNQDPDPNGVMGKTTAEMLTYSTFANSGWDFTNETFNGTSDFWRMCTSGINYPRLNWESRKGDFSCPDGVNIEDLSYSAGWWLMDNCTSANNYCGGTDLNFSGAFNLTDFSIFAALWLNDLTSVPDLSGMSGEDAEAAIVAAGLVVGTISEELSETVAAGHVISQSPSAGQVVLIGSLVNIVVSEGYGVSVPDLSGMSGEDAEAAIVAAGLVVGTVSEQFSETVAIGYVVSQSPSASQVVSVGSLVNIIISNGSAMVFIPGGTFSMGDNFEEGNLNERPVHTVTLNPFYLDKYEMTNQQYCNFLNWADDNGWITVSSNIVYKAGSGTIYPYCDTHASSTYSQINYSGGVFSVLTKGGRSMVNDPISRVSWYGAAAYCNWRSELEGKESCYNLSTWECDFTKNGYRLPTEAQWEYAARGGLGSKRFPWGDTITHAQSNYNKTGSYSYDISPTSGYHPIWMDTMPYTSPVGFFDGTMKYKTDFNWPGSETSYQTTSGANGYGLFDMAGNVYEWCNDWYSDTYYASSPELNPQGPATGMHRTIRSGSWVHNAFYSRTAQRQPSSPSGRNDTGGFRICLGY